MTNKDTIEVEFENSLIPDGTFRRLDEKTVRKDGCIWRVHNNDLDPFPSKPHAHNIESGLKLHLGSGGLYFGSKDTGNRISTKNLCFIRDELRRSGIELPPLA